MGGDIQGTISIWYRHKAISILPWNAAHTEPNIGVLIEP